MTYLQSSLCQRSAVPAKCMLDHSEMTYKNVTVLLIIRLAISPHTPNVLCYVNYNPLEFIANNSLLLVCQKLKVKIEKI